MSDTPKKVRVGCIVEVPVYTDSDNDEDFVAAINASDDVSTAIAALTSGVMVGKEIGNIGADWPVYVSRMVLTSDIASKYPEASDEIRKHGLEWRLING